MERVLNTIILKNKTLKLDTNEIAMLTIDLIKHGKSGTFGVSLKDFVGNSNEVCEITGEKGAIKYVDGYRSTKSSYTLKPSVMLRLFSKTLMPSEWRKLQFTHANDYYTHDDFYDYNSGIAVQPLIERYFEKGEYKKFNRDELKDVIKSEMLYFTRNDDNNDLPNIKRTEIELQDIIKYTFNDKKGWWDHLKNPHFNICMELLSGKPREDVINELVGNMKFPEKISHEKELSR